MQQPRHYLTRVQALSALHTLARAVLALGGECYYHRHFTDVETERQGEAGGPPEVSQLAGHPAPEPVLITMSLPLRYRGGWGWGGSHAQAQVGGKPDLPVPPLIKKKKALAQSLGGPEPFILTHFCHWSQRLTPGQSVGDKSVCWLRGQASPCCLGLEGEQSILECGFWEAAWRSRRPLASADR